ncbi:MULTISPECIES: hypothetical protein [Leuconostoc]|uniref:hypothetical protein n=1 Tax=Leuconostoc TaxID=1243 RepID=UPI001908DA8B|nr:MULTISPECIES: hypothetical protein [Leuconostoc]MBK0041651.1 hypothetical protein [Leuconostoc sp. S51]MBK0052587.1 hypothetical protein [Leuconostoc sp. S50]MBS0958928.1 hypothetical protein [Leuconostoc pseudomesenteroides]MCT4380648.1 hypothetical protein [Leuconostoc pseudomesenteroides]MDN2452059.1 hypothetical protein [Leuconostoc sp. UCMA20149]
MKTKSKTKRIDRNILANGAMSLLATIIGGLIAFVPVIIQQNYETNRSNREYITRMRIDKDQELSKDLVVYYNGLDDYLSSIISEYQMKSVDSSDEFLKRKLTILSKLYSYNMLNNKDFRNVDILIPFSSDSTGEKWGEMQNLSKASFDTLVEKAQPNLLNENKSISDQETLKTFIYIQNNMYSKYKQLIQDVTEDLSKQVKKIEGKHS